MAKAKNAVIAGDFVGFNVASAPAGVRLAGITNDGARLIWLNRSTVERCELISSEPDRSPVASVARGLIGDALFGTAGMVAGVMTTKDRGNYRVAIYFRSDDPAAPTCGKHSLLEINEQIYQKLVSACF